MSWHDSIEAIERRALLDHMRVEILPRIDLDDRDRAALDALIVAMREHVEPRDAIPFARGIADAFELRDYLLGACCEIHSTLDESRPHAINVAMSYRDRATRAALAALGIDRPIAAACDPIDPITSRAKLDERARPHRVDRFGDPTDSIGSSR